MLFAAASPKPAGMKNSRVLKYLVMDQGIIEKRRNHRTQTQVAQRFLQVLILPMNLQRLLIFSSTFPSPSFPAMEETFSRSGVSSSDQRKAIAVVIRPFCEKGNGVKTPLMPDPVVLLLQDLQCYSPSAGDTLLCVTSWGRFAGETGLTGVLEVLERKRGKRIKGEKCSIAPPLLNYTIGFLFRPLQVPRGHLHPLFLFSIFNR